MLYPDGLNQLFLWDVQAEQAILALKGTISPGVTPRWSPDGEYIIVSGTPNLMDAPPRSEVDLERQELFRTARNGEVERLTYLTDEFQEVKFDDYAWSPDGRYVAFSLELAPQTYPNLYPNTREGFGWLAVLDTVTWEVTDYCVPFHTLNSPVWVPNGHQLVFTTGIPSAFETGISGYEAYFIDLADNFAIKIAENVLSVGWIEDTR